MPMSMPMVPFGCVLYKGTGGFAGGSLAPDGGSCVLVQSAVPSAQARTCARICSCAGRQLRAEGVLFAVKKVNVLSW